MNRAPYYVAPGARGRKSGWLVMDCRVDPPAVVEFWEDVVEARRRVRELNDGH